MQLMLNYIIIIIIISTIAGFAKTVITLISKYMEILEQWYAEQTVRLLSVIMVIIRGFGFMEVIIQEIGG